MLQIWCEMVSWPQVCHTVALHVVEEFWQLLQDPATLHKVPVEDDSDSSGELMSLSVYAVSGVDTAETIKIVGNLLILIDSGSSSTFICEQMVAMLPNWVPLSAPVSVRVADGTSILCTHEIRQCPIYIQGYLSWCGKPQRGGGMHPPKPRGRVLGG